MRHEQWLTRWRQTVDGLTYDRSPMARPHRTDDELQRASNHVAYEVERLFGTLSDLSELHVAHQLGEARSPWTRDALLESWTIHLRNVLHVLRGEKAQLSDILAEDYIADWYDVLSSDLGRRAAREMGLVKDPDEEHLDWRINKEIVHLTYDRLDISLEARLWSVGDVTQHLGRDFQVFVDHVAPERVERSFFDRVEAALSTFTFSLPNRP